MMSPQLESAMEESAEPGVSTMVPVSTAAVPGASEAVPSTEAPLDRWAAWDRFCELTPAAGFRQSSWWADFRTTVGYGHFGEILKIGGAIVGGALVQRFVHCAGNAFYYIQDGPVLPEEPALAADVLAAILEAIQERRASDTEAVSHLRIEPRWDRSNIPLAGFQPVVRPDRYVEPRNTLCLDLRPSPEAILAAIRPKGRSNIAVARRHGVSIVEDTTTWGLADFLGIYQDTAARRRFRPKPSSYFESLLAVTAPERRGSIYFAEHEGMRLAAAFVLRFGSRATCLYGGALAERRHVMAPYLLHFEILSREKQTGHETYDLWGGTPEGSMFKRRFGGREVRLAPTLDYVYDRDAYACYAGWEATRRMLDA